MHAGAVLEAKLDIQQAVMPELGSDINPLRLTVDPSQADMLHFKIEPLVGGRWEIPEWLFLRPPGDLTPAVCMSADLAWQHPHLDLHACKCWLCPVRPGMIAA